MPTVKEVQRRRRKAREDTSDQRAAALVHYLECGHHRSLKATRAWYITKFGTTISQITINRWSRADKWVEKASQHDIQYEGGTALVELRKLMEQLEGKPVPELLKLVGEKFVLAVLATPVVVRTVQEQRAAMQTAVDALKLRELILSPESAEARDQQVTGRKTELHVHGDMHLHGSPVLASLNDIERRLRLLGAPSPDAASVAAAPAVSPLPVVVDVEATLVAVSEKVSEHSPDEKAHHQSGSEPAPKPRDIAVVAETAEKYKISFSEALSKLQDN